MTPSAAAVAPAKSKAAAAGRQQFCRRTRLLLLLTTPLDVCVTTLTSTLTPAHQSSSKEVAAASRSEGGREGGTLRAERSTCGSDTLQPRGAAATPHPTRRLPASARSASRAPRLLAVSTRSQQFPSCR